MRCPYCLSEIVFPPIGGQITLYEGWHEFSTGYKAPDEFSSDAHTFKGGYCPGCRGKLVLQFFQPWKDDQGQPISKEKRQEQFVGVVFPRKGMLRPLPAEVPAQFKADYDEACLVLVDSPKSSAALSRRLLQRIFHEHFKIKKKDLFQEIDEYIKTKTPPSDLADQLHAVRNVGNMAAHPLQDMAAGTIVDVQSGEAEWLLELIDALLDEVFVRPARDAARKASLNAKLTALGKAPMK